MTESVLYEGYPGIVRSGKMWAGKLCTTFLVMMKNIIVEKKLDIFLCSVSNKNHVTTHPVDNVTVYGFPVQKISIVAQ